MHCMDSCQAAIFSISILPVAFLRYSAPRHRYKVASCSHRSRRSAARLRNQVGGEVHSISPDADQGWETYDRQSNPNPRRIARRTGSLVPPYREVMHETREILDFSNSTPAQCLSKDLVRSAQGQVCDILTTGRCLQLECQAKAIFKDTYKIREITFQ